jgi:hypothetical protein
MNKGLTVKTGQTHVNRCTDDLLKRIQDRQIDPSFAVAGVTLLDVLCAQALTAQKQRVDEAVDYSDHSGWPNGLPAARGAAAAPSDRASLRAEPMVTSSTSRPQPLEVMS